MGGKVGAFGELPVLGFFKGGTEDAMFAEWDGSTWIETTVESANRVGKAMRLAVGADGRPRIAYLDQDQSSAHVAERDASGVWSITVPAQSTDPAGLAVDFNGDVALLVRGTNQSAPLQLYSGSKTGSGLAWTHDPGFPGSGLSYGQIAFDAAGNLHVVAADPQGGALVYMTNASGTWTSSCA